MTRSDLRDAYQAAIDAELEYQVELAHTWLRILGESDENTATIMVALDERLVALQRAWLEAAADRDRLFIPCDDQYLRPLREGGLADGFGSCD